MNNTKRINFLDTLNTFTHFSDVFSSKSKNYLSTLWQNSSRRLTRAFTKVDISTHFNWIEVETHSSKEIFRLTYVHPKPLQFQGTQLTVIRHVRKHFLLYAHRSALKDHKNNEEVSYTLLHTLIHKRSFALLKFVGEKTTIKCTSEKKAQSLSSSWGFNPNLNQWFPWQRRATLLGSHFKVGSSQNKIRKDQCQIKIILVIILIVCLKYNF